MCLAERTQTEGRDGASADSGWPDLGHVTVPPVMVTALLRNVAGITAHVALAVAVVAAIAADADHALPSSATSADRVVIPAVHSLASPAATPSPGLAGTAPRITGSPASGAAANGTLGPPPAHLVVPDLLASVTGGFTVAQLAEIAALSGVRAVLPADGGRVTINGKTATVLGVSPHDFRSWAPPETAGNADIWTALANGDLVASRAAASLLGLTPGTALQLSGASATPVIDAATSPLGLGGVDAIVDPPRAGQLGLAANIAVLINAPGADLAALMQQIRSLIGPTGDVVNLVPIASTSTADQLPVVRTVPSGTPTNYLTLYQDSAAEYCPGLSWTVLAAIGQIESGHGANNGPSSAGALGPMQFLPSTWAVWGTDGFGQTGSPDIMNPLDAVPSAARMLCADGAAAGGASLAAAIFDYNHADWYVSEVLALAHEYAQAYG